MISLYDGTNSLDPDPFDWFLAMVMVVIMACFFMTLKIHVKKIVVLTESKIFFQYYDQECTSILFWTKKMGGYRHFSIYEKSKFFQLPNVNSCGLWHPKLPKVNS